MSKQSEVLAAILKFREERDWKQFHTLTEMIKGLNVEAGELLAETLWLNETELKDKALNTDKISDELADIYYWVLLIANDLKLDLNQAALDKLEKNKLKYPVDKSKGSKEKYSSL